MNKASELIIRKAIVSKIAYYGLKIYCKNGKLFSIRDRTKMRITFELLEGIIDELDIREEYNEAFDKAVRDIVHPCVAFSLVSVEYKNGKSTFLTCGDDYCVSQLNDYIQFMDIFALVTPEEPLKISYATFITKDDTGTAIVPAIPFEISFVFEKKHNIEKMSFEDAFEVLCSDESFEFTGVKGTYTSSKNKIEEKV